MRLKGYLVIGYKDGKAGERVILACTAAPPAQVLPSSRVAEIIIDIPEDIFDTPVIKTKWPTGEVPEEVLAEIKDWTAK